MLIAVDAAPPKLIVVAVVLSKLAVVWVVVIDPPLTATLPEVVILPLFAIVNSVVPEEEAERISSFSV